MQETMKLRDKLRRKRKPELISEYEVAGGFVYLIGSDNIAVIGGAMRVPELGGLGTMVTEREFDETSKEKIRTYLQTRGYDQRVSFF